MVAHQWHEGSPLHPAGLQFLKGWVLRILFKLPVEETAQVGVPERNATEREVQARRNLVLHLVPGSQHVATPADGAIMLNTETAASGHLERTLCVALHRSLVLVDALVVQQWKGVLHAQP